MTHAEVFPELVTGREDDFVTRPWTVESGTSMRGEASCNITERILEVPLGTDDVSRVVRAHELMHSRVSPHDLDWNRLFGDVSPRALECAEELRVNTLLARVGFDVSCLRDGTEKGGGRRLGEAGDWSQALCFLLAVIGTGAERDYLSGVRAGSVTWLPALRAVRKRALRIMEECPTSQLGATAWNTDGVPSGYADSTLVVARLVTQSMTARVPIGADELRAFRRSLEPGGRRPPSGRFAELQFGDRPPMSRRARRAGVRRALPSTTGTVMRRPERLLTDPHRRAFERVSRRHGGVVVIDQSGSMDIGPDEIARLLRCAPDSLVVGYSHRPGDLGATPNAWVLAERGRVCDEGRTGNVGNGVDGPILRWASRERRPGEPIVWVTDGQVTDSNDHPDDVLTMECARLVLENAIRMVRDLDAVVACLSRSLIRADYRAFGRVGRKLGELKALCDRAQITSK